MRSMRAQKNNTKAERSGEIMFKHKKKIIGSLQAATALALCISMAFAASYSSKADVKNYGSKTLTGNLVRTGYVGTPLAVFQQRRRADARNQNRRIRRRALGYRRTRRRGSVFRLRKRGGRQHGVFGIRSKRQSKKTQKVNNRFAQCIFKQTRSERNQV